MYRPDRFGYYVPGSTEEKSVLEYYFLPCKHIQFQTSLAFAGARHKLSDRTGSSRADQDHHQW